ncbi:MAG: tRNA (adenosine(37)-N6)-threonylcarbamoyltransferase complex dimerization subunit type 1 TsaB [Burkholderiaceae bacterium]
MNASSSVPVARRFDAATDLHAPDLTLLAIGTSTERCSVAVLRRRRGEANGFVIDSRPEPGQSGRVLGLVREALGQAGASKRQLDAIAFDAGPGAFTGLRVGCGVAQGLGFALDRPLLPVSSLAAIAVPAEPSPGVGPCERWIAVDARMQELYWTIVPADADPAAEPALDIRVGPAGDASRAFDARRARLAAMPGGGWPVLLLGNGFERSDALRAWAEETDARREPLAWPSADRIAVEAERLWRRGRAVPAERAAPLYVRDKVALDASEQARLRAANRSRSERDPSPVAASRERR